MTRRSYITTAIPYVNAAPHLGFALELVQADVLARHHRSRGWAVRFQTGTDDNSLKNVHAAAIAGVGVRELVDRNADAFDALRQPLALSFDDFVRTSSDPRHRPGVEWLWRSCDRNGDLYRKHYDGLYCVGCEQFYVPGELTADGVCPEHGIRPERHREENWFFRLSRHEDAVRDLIAGNRLRIQPESRRNEALAFIAGGLEDFSVSRSVTRARGWGIPVPDDPSQVVYVWYDALANYLTGLGFGAAPAPEFRRWWVDADRRVHVVGKGILRFHAVYWPAILLSAGLPVPTDIMVHDYLTVDGRKLGKSLGNAIDPVELVDRFGTDALRWWLVRDVPRTGDADFTVARLVDRANGDLANGFGNLASRVSTLVHRRLGGTVPATASAPIAEPDRRLLAAYGGVASAVDDALDDFDLRRASGAVLDVVGEANRYLETVQPWTLSGDRLATALALLVHAGRTVAVELAPFVPNLSERLLEQFGGTGGTALPPPAPLYARLPVDAVQPNERNTSPVRGLGQK